MQLKSFRLFAICAVCAALGFAAALPFVAFQSEKAPEFYGAFSAAIIAAAALLLSAYYQDNLNRQRDENLRNKASIANAIDLCFWLDHAVNEFEFISNIMKRFRDSIVAGDKAQLEMPAEQFREAISSHLFDELLNRAKIASQLPPDIAGTITRDIYETYTTTDRVFKLRGASSDFRPSLKAVDDYLFILNRRVEKLRAAASLIEAYLVEEGALTSDR